MARIIVTIPKDDTEDVRVEVEGMLGPNCKSLTAGIEKALGVVTSDVETDEFHQGRTRQDLRQDLRGGTI